MILDALRAALANTGALVREKFFKKTMSPLEEVNYRTADIDDDADSSVLSMETEKSASSKRGGKSFFLKNPFSHSVAHNRKGGLDIPFGLGPRVISVESIGAGRDQTSSLPGSTHTTSVVDDYHLSLEQKGKLIFGKHFVL